MYYEYEKHKRLSMVDLYINKKLFGCYVSLLFTSVLINTSIIKCHKRTYFDFSVFSYDSGIFYIMHTNTPWFSLVKETDQNQKERIIKWGHNK